MVRKAKKIRQISGFNKLSFFLLVSFFIAAGIAFYQLTFAKSCPTLKQGTHGACVKSLQHSLNTLGANPRLVEDGKFSAETEAAVRQFQKDNGLRISGVVGRQTRERIGVLVRHEVDCIGYANQGKPCPVLYL